MAFEDTVDLIKASLANAGDDAPADDADLPSADEFGEPVEDAPEEIPEEEPVADEPVVEEEPTTEEPAVEPVAEVEPPVAEKPAKEPAKEDVDELAGIAAKDSRGRENRIPYSAVVRINKNAVKKATDVLSTQFATEKAELVKVNAAYKETLENVGVTEKIMFGEQGKFLSMLIEAIPGYREILGPHVERNAEGHVVGIKASAAPAAVLDPTDPEPKPDVNENGQIGYSPEQFTKLRQWERRQAVAEGVRIAEERIGKTYKPVLDAYTTHQKARETIAARDNGINAQIQEASKWPGWETHWKETLKVMDADYQLHQKDRQYAFPDIKSAYLHVLNAKATKQAETTAQMEARIAKETQERLRRAPKSTSASSVASGAGIEREAPADTGTQSTADLVRAAIKKGRA
jgi:hypothetical protein